MSRISLVLCTVFLISACGSRSDGQAKGTAGIEFGIAQAIPLLAVSGDELCRQLAQVIDETVKQGAVYPVSEFSLGMVDQRLEVLALLNARVKAAEYILGELQSGAWDSMSTGVAARSILYFSKAANGSDDGLFQSVLFWMKSKGAYKDDKVLSAFVEYHWRQFGLAEKLKKPGDLYAYYNSFRRD